MAKTLQEIINNNLFDVEAWLNGNDMTEDLYDQLYDYYLSIGEMPYGVAKARTGDPMVWVDRAFYSDAIKYVDNVKWAIYQ